MFFEFVYRFLSFDVAWLIDFVFDPHSLFWLFAMLMVSFYFYGEKKLLWATVFFLFFNWAFGDVAPLMGWPIVPALLAAVFLYNVFAEAFIAHDKSLSRWTAQFGLVAVFGLWFLLTFVFN